MATEHCCNMWQTTGHAQRLAAAHSVGSAGATIDRPFACYCTLFALF